MPSSRLAAWGGVIGPAAFVTAWLAGGATKSDYSPVDDAISRLAAVGASTRPLMTTGLVAFGVGVPLFAAALRASVPGPAWMAAAATGLATLGIAAVPLDASATTDVVHAWMAALGYVTLAATPLLAAGPLAALGHRRAARASLVVGAVTGLALVATLLLPGAHGLLQRAGLALGHAWIVATAVWILRTDGRERDRSSGLRP